MADTNLTLRVVSPESTVFSGEARSVVAPAWDGRVGIMPGHAPMIALLGVGPLSIATADGARTFHVAGGLIKVESDQVVVLTEYAADEPAPEDLVRSVLASQADFEGTPSTAGSPSSSS